jgi:hypothetical protein
MLEVSIASLESCLASDRERQRLDGPMIERLRQIEASYDAVVAEMATPAAASDPARLQVLGAGRGWSRSWRRSVRGPRIRDELEATRSMAHDPDEEVRAWPGTSWRARAPGAGDRPGAAAPPRAA